MDATFILRFGDFNDRRYLTWRHATWNPPVARFHLGANPSGKSTSHLVADIDHAHPPMMDLETGQVFAVLFGPSSPEDYSRLVALGWEPIPPPEWVIHEIS